MHAGHQLSICRLRGCWGFGPSAPAPAMKRTEADRVAVFVWHTDIPLSKGNHFYVKLWWIGPLHIEKGGCNNMIWWWWWWWWWWSHFNVTGQRLSSGPSRLVGCFQSLEGKLGEKWIGVHWCPCFLFGKMVVKGCERSYTCIFICFTYSIYICNLA